MQTCVNASKKFTLANPVLINKLVVSGILYISNEKLVQAPAQMIGVQDSDSWVSRLLHSTTNHANSINIKG